MKVNDRIWTKRYYIGWLSAQHLENSLFFKKNRFFKKIVLFQYSDF